MAFCSEKYKKTQKSMRPEKERTGHIKLDDQIALTVLLFSSEHSESECSHHGSREHLNSETA